MKIISPMLMALCALSSAAEAIPAAQPTGQHQITEITFERTMCLGSCPAYRVSLKRSGQAIYFGKAHAPRHGVHNATIYKWQFDRLATLLVDQGFFHLRTSYSTNVTCGASAILSARIKGKWHRVSNYRSAGPTSLWGLEMATDAVIDQLNWKRRGVVAHGQPSQRILREMNDLRKRKRLPPLVLDKSLTRWAGNDVSKWIRRPGWGLIESYAPAVHIRARLVGCRLRDPKAVVHADPALLDKHVRRVGIAAEKHPKDGTWCAEIVVGDYGAKAAQP